MVWMSVRARRDNDFFAVPADRRVLSPRLELMERKSRGLGLLLVPLVGRRAENTGVTVENSVQHIPSLFGMAAPEEPKPPTEPDLLKAVIDGNDAEVKIMLDAGASEAHKKFSLSDPANCTDPATGFPPLMLRRSTSTRRCASCS